jgi:transcriptional regulator with XRE-family HTH domain
MICFMLSKGSKVRRARESQSPPWSQYDLEEKSGVSRSKISQWEIDRTEPKESDLRKVAKALGIAEEWFYDGLDNAVPLPSESKKQPEPLLSDPMGVFSYGYRNLRYAGVVPCGEWGDPLDSEEMIPISAELEHPKRYAATVAGDSCYPALRQGDLTIWHYDLAPASGLIVLAQRKGDHGCTVKQLRINDLGEPHLVPINPKYEEPTNGDGWGTIARLVAVIRDDGRIKHYFIQLSGLKPEDLT